MEENFIKFDETKSVFWLQQFAFQKWMFFSMINVVFVVVLLDTEAHSAELNRQNLGKSWTQEVL